MLFKKILRESNHKPNKIWIDKGTKYYNWSIELWLEKNAVTRYSTHNKGKSVVPQKFTKTLENKI